MKTISIINNKGGVGKTTTAFHLSIRLSNLGYKVLAIDADAQCNLTQRMRITNDKVSISKISKLDFTDLNYYNENLAVVTGSLKIESINIKSFEIGIKDFIRSCEEYFDYCIIDCAPRLFGVQKTKTTNEVIVSISDCFLIPIFSDQSSLLGLDKVVESINYVKEKNNNCINVFFSRAETNTVLFKKSKALLNNVNSNLLMNNVIRKNEDIVKAEMVGKSIYDYNASANGSKDYINLADELLARIK